MKLRDPDTRQYVPCIVESKRHGSDLGCLHPTGSIETKVAQNTEHGNSQNTSSTTLKDIFKYIYIYIYIYAGEAGQHSRRGKYSGFTLSAYSNAKELKQFAYLDVDDLDIDYSTGEFVAKEPVQEKEKRTPGGKQSGLGAKRLKAGSVAGGEAQGPVARSGTGAGTGTRQRTACGSRPEAHELRGISS